jgi:hypothetical protein
MLVADTPYGLWDVLGNKTYPAYEKDNLGGVDPTMKNFFADPSNSYEGYWGSASSGNNYPGGDLTYSLGCYFITDTSGVYEVTIYIINLTDSSVIKSFPVHIYVAP